MGIDLKKEIKLSDLFKRKPKEAAPVAEAASVEDAALVDDPKPGRASLMRRGRPKADKAPKEPKAEKAPKAPKVRAEKTPRHDHQPHHAPLMRAFNLLPKDDPREARSVRPRAAQLVLAIVAVVLVAGLGAAYTVVSATVDDKRTTRDALRAEVEALRQQALASGQVEQVDPALVSEKNLRTYALASALSGRVAWDRLLREVSLVTPEDVWLSGLAAAPAESDAAAGQSALTVNGYTHGQEGVARMLARLAVVPELSAVQLVSSASTLIGDIEVVQFSISALVKLPGGDSA